MAAFVSPGAVTGVSAVRPQPQPPDPVVITTGSAKSSPSQRAAGLDVPGVLAAVACGSLIVVIAASFTGVIGTSAAAPATLAARMPPALGTRAGIDVLLIALFVAAGSAALTMSLRQRAPALFGRLTGRTVLGLAFLVGADALIVALFRTSASQQLGRALGWLLGLMASAALLGPALAVVAGLALAGVRARHRRMAPAVIPVALGVVFAGTVYFADATIGHASLDQARQRLVATEVVTAPGRGLAPAAVGAIARRPGVTAAVGLTPVPVAVDDPGLGPVAGELVTGGNLTRVLDLGVTSGSLRGFGPGDIAVSQQQAGPGAMGVRVGEMVTVHLSGDVGYRARVTAIYHRSLGFGDVVVPAAAAFGRLGPASVGQILVRGGTPAGLAGLAARFPGLQVAGRRAVNARAQQLDAPGGVAGDLLLGVIALLAAATLASTLVTAAAGPRPAAAGAVAIGVGMAAGAITLTTVSRAVTGGWPYLPPGPAAVIAGSVLALAVTAALSRPARPRSPAPARPAG
jgi:putative ABC transport system permease protein